MNKVLIITPGFAANENDSSAVPYLQDYIYALREEIGPENIKIITMQYPFTRQPYSWNGIEVIPSGGKNKGGVFFYFTLRRTRKNIQHFLRQSAFAIHAFWLGEAAFAGQMGAKNFNAPFMITMMGQDARASNRSTHFIRLENAITVCLSENQGKVFFESTGKHANYIIPLPVKKIHLPSNTIRNTDLLFNGSFIEIKQPLLFVEIVSSLYKRRPEIKAIMCGNGPLMNEVIQEIKNLGLVDVITLTGIIPREEVFIVMQQSKILVHTSSYEGQCHSYLEAFANGMYVVSFDVGRIERSDKHIVCRSAEEMVSAADELLASNLNFTQQYFFSGKEVADQYIKLYNP